MSSTMPHIGKKAQPGVLMGKKKRPTKKKRERHDYYMEVMSWQSASANRRRIEVKDRELQEEEKSHSISVALEVRVLNPIKEVHFGTVDINCREEKLWHPNWTDEKVFDSGGFLDYRKRGSQQVLSGHVWASMSAMLHLIMLLQAGQRVVLSLRGDAFYRRSALIRDTEWFTYGHTDFMEDLAHEIEQHPPPT